MPDFRLRQSLRWNYVASKAVRWVFNSWPPHSSATITPNATEEVKLDGFRALAYLENGEGRLLSRNGNTFASFRDLAAEVAADFRGTDAVLDGEMVCVDDGCPQYEDSMFRRGELVFVAFNALWIDCEDDA